MRLLLAARLSQTTRGQTGITSQDQDMQEWSEDHGHTIVATVADHQSGTAAMWHRPNLQPWVTDPELMGKYDGILAAKQDRLSRADFWDEIAIREWAERNHKVLFIADKDMKWPPDDEDDVQRWNDGAAAARREWLSTSKRYRRMQQALRAANCLVGKPPWGFIAVPHPDEPDHKTLSVDPELEPLLIGMIHRTLRGDTFASICQWLDASGVPPAYGGLWHSKSLTQILRNPCLKGRQVDAKGKTILTFDGLVNSREFDQLQQALDNRPNKRGPVKGQTAMLTNIVVCAKCGRPLYRFRTHNTRKNGSKYVKRYYRCKGTDQQPSTCRNMVPLPTLHDWLDLWFTIGASEGGTFGDVEIVETIIIPGHGYEDEIADVEAKLKELDFDDPAFADKQAALLAERKHWKNLPTAPAETLERPTGILVKDHWRSLDEQGKRAYLLDARVQVHARMIWQDEADRLSRRPGELDAWLTGNPARVVGSLRRQEPR